MNLSEVLRTLGIPGTRNPRGWTECVCPWCHGVGYLGIHEEGTVSCWRCGRHRLVETLALLSGKPWQEVREALGQWTPRSVPKQPTTGTLEVPAGVGPLLPAHRRYLEGRGFDPDELAEVWGIGGIGIAPRLTWRLFIPIHRGEEVVSWTTRGLTDAEPRYLSARSDQEAIPKRNLLYGEHLAGHAVVVVEGPFDAWRIGPGAVATLGIGFSPVQVARIARFPRRTVAFDAEPKAQERAQRLCDHLGALPGTTYRVELETGNDVASCDVIEVRQLRRFLT